MKLDGVAQFLSIWSLSNTNCSVFRWYWHIFVFLKYGTSKIPVKNFLSALVRLCVSRIQSQVHASGQISWPHHDLQRWAGHCLNLCKKTRYFRCCKNWHVIKTNGEIPSICFAAARRDRISSLIRLQLPIIFTLCAGILLLAVENVLDDIGQSYISQFSKYVFSSSLRYSLALRHIGVDWP